MALDYLLIAEAAPICIDLPDERTDCHPGTPTLYIDTPKCDNIFSGTLDKIEYKENPDDGSVDIRYKETNVVIRISPIEYNPHLKVNFCYRYEEMKNKPLI